MHSHQALHVVEQARLVEGGGDLAVVGGEGAAEQVAAGVEADEDAPQPLSITPPK